MADDRNETDYEETAIDIVRNQPLVIFKTQADLVGRDVTQMSNFFDGYIEQMSLALREQSDIEILADIPVADLGIVGEVIHRADVILQGKTMLLPDFDNLPVDIRKKLKDGVYSIGESKQVDGNLRAVILDENNMRVKDITLKRVTANQGNLEAARSIGNQLQMRQIFAKLEAIEEFQMYQLERDRDQSLVVPFLNARSHVLLAASTEDTQERTRLLRLANDEITGALHSVYTDMDTTSRYLAKRTRIPFFVFGGQMDSYMRYLTSDLQIATKYVGASMQILDYLGESKAAQGALMEYQQAVLDFIEKPLRKGLSAADIMHDYFPYDESNRNYWYTFSRDVKPALEASMQTLQLGMATDAVDEVLLVSVEDTNNE